MEDLPGKFKPNCLRFLHVSVYSTAGSTNFQNCSRVICWCFQEATTKIILSEIVTHTKFFLPLSLNTKNKIKTKNYPRGSGCPQYAKFGHVTLFPQRMAMNGNETGTVEYSTELTFNSNLPNLIVLNVEFYMLLIWQFDSVHVKFDV